MTNNKNDNRILAVYKTGLINSYMAKRLSSLSTVDEDNFIEAVADAKIASDAGINSDADYNTYFFIKKHAYDFLDEVLDNYNNDDVTSLCSYAMSYKDNPAFDLTKFSDYKSIFDNWLCELITKSAYPNIDGKSSRENTADLSKWVSTLKYIYAQIHSNQMTKLDAFDHFTANWDNEEKVKFANWMKYYEEDTVSKYDVKLASIDILKTALLPGSWVNPVDRESTQQNVSIVPVPQKTEKEKKVEMALAFRTKMRSRLLALKKLVDQYNNLLPHQDITKIYDEIYSLDKSLSQLQVYASMQDVVIRSANRMYKMGFSEGADLLSKFAEGEDVTQSLPAQLESGEPDLPPQSKTMINAQTVINRLEGVSKILKSRDIIRELAAIDILLNEMGIASHFPELTDSQAKLIEAFGYASNKIESIVAKLRGSGTSKLPSLPQGALQNTLKPIPQAHKEPMENIKTDELHTKPVGQVKKELPKG